MSIRAASSATFRWCRCATTEGARAFMIGCDGGSFIATAYGEDLCQNHRGEDLCHGEHDEGEPAGVERRVEQKDV